MGLFFYNKIGSIISIGDLPTTNIIEPRFIKKFQDYFFKLLCIEKKTKKGYTGNCG